MSPGSCLIIFCTLAVFSLTSVSIVNKREERQRALKQQQRQLRFKLQDLEELVLNISQLVDNRQIVRLLNEELLETILAAKQSAAEGSVLDALHHTALARHETLSADPQDTSPHDDELPALDRLQRSDAAIAQAKRRLTDALIILRRQQRQGKIQLDELRLLQLDLSWASLMVEVISLLGQGHESVRRREIFTAQAFYKRAQQLLIHSSHPDKRRPQFIREITELMEGKRRSISPQLMPESALNPDATVEAQLLDLPLDSGLADEAGLAVAGLEAWQS